MHFWTATRKGLFQITPAASGWRIGQAAFVGENVSLMLEDRGVLYAALDHGHFGAKLHRSTDGGMRWEALPCPAFPEKPEGHVDRDGSGKELPWTVMRIWSLEPGADPGELWCGTIPGALFHSRDGGQSWTWVRSLWEHEGRREWFGGGADYPGIHSICVHPQDGDRVLVGVSCGGVWSTADRGRTWTCRAEGMRAAYMPPERARDPRIQDPHRLVRCPRRPEFLWTQHHNGVFRSVDESASWQEVEVPPSSFGFAVAVHPEDPQVAWFLPAQKDEHRVPVSGQVVVTRTRDGGRSFDVLRNGLPQEHAYDIVYRHALDVSPDGRCLAFGSTTGSLWVSPDQGDSWQAVSHHLPPVYAVRFTA